MKLAALSLAILFGSCPLFSQSVASAQFTVRNAQASSGCPVEMRLDQVVSSSARQAENGQSRMVFRTRLHLVLSQSSRAEIFLTGLKSAAVTIHGYNGKPRFELVAPGDAPEAKSLKVQFISAGDNKASSDFVVAGLASASRLDINSLSFANGATWKPAKGQSCIVRPSMVMLISQPANAGK